MQFERRFHMKVGFIGAGNMTSAIVKGMIKAQHLPKENIYISNRSPEKLEQLTKETGTVACSSNEELVSKVDVVILAIKPNLFSTVLPELSTHLLKYNPVVVSIAAGVSLAQMRDWIGSDSAMRLIRVMPNLNSQIGEGMAAVCGNEQSTQDDVEFVISIFQSIGEAIVMKEADFGVFSAIAGCSPAFTFLFIDSLARAAVKYGIPKEMATKIAAQAVLGSGKMVLESGETPWNLIDQVSSPGGTTIEGVLALEENGFMTSVVKAVDAVVEKDTNMN
ncbi:pyrroline-5-carboxylate reductase [Desemzia sp. FAM 23991]|uniref:pyrroline-5-carboxylate reductase n=1 Tax=unclassified Desemzia TaxID=2685243 RepID=UPI00388A6F93